MKEITFLKRNKEKWEGFEQFLRLTPQADPDRLSDLFVELTDDLSYARTYYPSSNSEKYLNDLTAKVHQHIYQNKKENSKRIITFWTHEFPLMFRQCHKQLLYAFLIFGFSFFIGSMSQYFDDSFARIILGDSYVNMTLDNIENGDPMAVYKGSDQSGMAAGIAMNNILVAFMAVVGGITFSMWTIYLLFTNGIMLGSFITFFYKTDAFEEAMMTIWIHGTIEISVIVIAGAAGFMIGNSIMFPKTYPRLVSFVRGAKNAIKTLIAIIPLFVIAALLEGFVTRHTNMPDWLSLLIILGSLAFVLFYFVFYPIYLERQNNLPALPDN